MAPHGSGHADKIKLNIVQAREEGTSDDKALCWNLLTTGAISSTEQSRDILRCYHSRWHIEGFRKAGKSSAKVEAMRMQNLDAWERMIIMLAQVAIHAANCVKP